MLDTLLQQLPGVWRADSPIFAKDAAIPTGFSGLDAALGGGWPQAGLLEFLCDQRGIGELQLLLPLLRYQDRVSNDEPSQVLWLNPPFVLHGVALAQCGVEPARQWLATGLKLSDVLWSMEQALRSGACGMVIAWVEHPALSSLRRLKLAASAGHCCGVLFRPACEAREVSPANVRALLAAQGADLEVHLLKVQGRLPTIVRLDVQARAEIGKDAHDGDS